MTAGRQWGFTLTFLFALGLRVRFQSKTGHVVNACTANRGDPWSLLCIPLTCSLSQKRSLPEWRNRVCSNEHFRRSWSAFGYGLRCSRLWDSDIRLLSISAPARKRSCLYFLDALRLNHVLSFHVETSLGHPGDGCLVFYCSFC